MFGVSTLNNTECPQRFLELVKLSYFNDIRNPWNRTKFFTGQELPF